MLAARGRASVFGKSVDQEVSGNVERALRSARVLLMNCMLLDGVILAETDAQTARSDLNEHIRSFSSGDIQVEDLHKAIWRQVQRITRGMATE